MDIQLSYESEEPLINKDLSQLNVDNDDIDSGFLLELVECYRTSPWLALLNFLLIILTCGILGIAELLSINLRLRINYRRVQEPTEATHYLVTTTKDRKLVRRINFDPDYFGFIYKGLKYSLNEEIFMPLYSHYYSKLSQKEVFQLSQDGLTPDQKIQIKRLFSQGRSQVDEQQSFFRFLRVQMMNSPVFYIPFLQIAIWVYEKNVVSIGITVLSQFLLLVICYCLLKKQEQTQGSKIQVLRGTAEKTQKIELDPTQLMPGDIFQVTTDQLIPCDCILTGGVVLLVDESYLNGESKIIEKQKMKISKDQKQKFSLSNQSYNKGSILFEGSRIQKIIQVPQEFPLVMVLRTGFSTPVGQLLRSSKYQQFERKEIFKSAYLLMLIFAFIYSGVFVYNIFIMFEEEISKDIILVSSFQTLIVGFPPTLMIYFLFNIVCYLQKLRGKGVACDRIDQLLASGKIDSMMFDKTGTLTESKMEVFGYVQAYELGKIVTNQATTIHERADSLLFKAFATCHNILQEDGKDSLDVSMVKFSGWSVVSVGKIDRNSVLPNSNRFLNPNPILFVSAFYSLDKQHIQVLKVFEFQSENQRMGVIVRIDNSHFFFTKGAPEQIYSLLTNKDKQYLQRQDQLQSQGLRVISVAMKEISDKDINLTRKVLEKDLKFLGFLVIQEQIRKESEDIIRDLDKAGINCQILSGDSSSTCIHIAREISLISQGKDTMVVDIDPDRDQLHIRIIPVLNGQWVSKTLKMDSITTNLKDKKYELVLTGGALDYFLAKCDVPPLVGIPQTSQEDHEDSQKDPNKYKNILIQICQNSKIFARMKPDQKKQIIQILQREGLIVGMVGDGVNDCAALKQADMGISFSGSESALASSFKVDSLQMVRVVLKRGYSFLNNVINMFRILISIQSLYNLNFNILISQGYKNNHIAYAWTQAIVACFLLILPQYSVKSFLMSKKNEVNFLSFKYFISIAGLNAIFFAGGCAMYYYVYDQNWEKEVVAIQGLTKTAFFLCNNIWVIFIILALADSFNFNQRIKKNKLFIFIFSIATSIGVVMFFIKQSIELLNYNINKIWIDKSQLSEDIDNIRQITPTPTPTPTPTHFRNILFWICLIIGFVFYFYEKILVKKFGTYINKKFQNENDQI